VKSDGLAKHVKSRCVANGAMRLRNEEFAMRLTCVSVLMDTPDCIVRKSSASE
jgi:hypothetical protein